MDKHNCDLNTRWKSVYFQNQFHTTSKLLNFIKRNNLIWKNHFATAQYFHSNCLIQEEIRRQINQDNWYIIHPLSRINYVREILMLIMWLFVIFKDPVRLSFFNFIPNRTASIKWIFRCADGLTLINMIIEFFVGYISYTTHEVILDHRLIVKRYLKTYFFVDFIGGFPIGTIYNFITGNEFIGYLINIHLMIRCLRLKYVFDIFWNLLCKSQEQQTYFRILTISIFSIYILEFWTCTIFFVSYILTETGIYKNSWITSINYNPNITQSEVFECFLRTLRIVGGIYYNIESGALMANDVEYLLSLLTRMSGFLLSTIILSLLLQITTATFLADTTFRIITKQLHMYADVKKLSPRLRNRLITFYEGVFKNCYFKIDVVIESLSTNLKQEILFHESRFLINRVKLFANLPQHIVQWIFLNSVKEHYLVNDVIAKNATILDSIYFIAYGAVTIVLSNGVEIRHLHDGEIIGDVALANQFQSLSTAIAIEFTEVLRLSYENLEKINAECAIKAKLLESGQQKLRICKMKIGEIKKLDKDYLEEVTTAIETKQNRQ